MQSNRELEKKINQLEKKYDENFRMVFEAIRKLINDDKSSVKKIGFRIGDRK